MTHEASRSKSLAGCEIALSGRFASMSQREMAQLVRKLGGRFIPRPRRSTTLLVLGGDGWPLQEDGQPAQNLQLARKIRAAGHPLEILWEEELLERVGLHERSNGVRRLYTIGQLSRILHVPGQRLRAWLRSGLIEPVETLHRLAYFDFRQVASAKTLSELLLNGVSPKQLREGLEHLRRWLPEVRQPLSQLAVLEHRGRLLVRLQSGLLAEPNGQLHFDFDTSSERSALHMPDRSADHWFDEAVALEEAGRFEDAAYSYQQALLSDPTDPVLYFNLGNVLYTLERVEDSVTQFREAVQRDASYVEAWNNLGISLGDLGQHEEAAAAIQRAIEIVPAYADAHYNLAETLLDLGRIDEAREHWQAYLKLDPQSEWAHDVRRRLRQTETEEDGAWVMRLP